jgi:hypothetical protein
MPLPTEILESIDEEYRTDPSIQDFNTINDLVKSAIETKAMVGNSVRKPGPDAGPEAYEKYLNQLINNDPTLMLKPDFAEQEQSHEFYRTIGLPEEAAKYENPEGMKLPEEVEAEMRSLLYDAQTPQTAYAKIMSAFSDRQAQTVELNTELHDSDMAQLKGKWGQALDDRTQAAKRMNEEFYPGRDFDRLNGTEVESLYNISKSMTGQSAHAAGDAGGIPTAITPNEAVSQAEEIMVRIHDTKNDLTHDQRMALQNKRIKMLQDAGVFKKVAIA